MWEFTPRILDNRFFKMDTTAEINKIIKEINELKEENINLATRITTLENKKVK